MGGAGARTGAAKGGVLLLPTHCNMQQAGSKTLKSRSCKNSAMLKLSVDVVNIKLPVAATLMLMLVLILILLGLVLLVILVLLLTVFCCVVVC